ncbi:MAG: hypothetical protein DSZ24_01455 [Thermodesulfatator sp.]|nr:MAG: hypothetical protein DSZ24_01455 [Thermodesulfatator sp.]
MVRLEVIDFGTPDYEVIIGQGNFTIKTIEDLYDVIYSSAPGIRFGAAMNEAKPKVVRVTGNDEELRRRAAEMALPDPPFVVKGNHGHEGREVFLIRGPADWQEALSRLRKWEASGRFGFLVQEYLPWEYDLRVVIIGRRRLPFWRKGGFRRNLVQEGRLVPCPVPELEARALELVEELIEKTGFDLVAVDLLFRPQTGEALLNELNFVFGLRLLGGEERFRIYLAEAVEEFLRAKA